MLDEDMRGNLQLLFRAKDFRGMWSTLNAMYDELRFDDKITDNQRIDEYRWIVQQLRKYMFSKQDDILGCQSLEDMIDKVDSLISNAAEYGEDRKHIAYNFLRDQWLFEVRNYMSTMLIEYSDDMEEEE